MDERVINGAAIEAINDLDIECEIKEVRKGAEKDEWCIQFSGKYGQLCDVFQNQFGKENSPQVIREKIKSHLINQVTRIRSNTGRRRKPVAADALENRESAGGLLAEPLKLMGEVLGRATGLAGDVISRASEVAETARTTLAAADLDTDSPETTEVGGAAGQWRQTNAPPTRPTSRTTLQTPAEAQRTVEKKAPAQKARPKKAAAKRVVTKKAVTKKPVKRAGGQAKKAGATAPQRAARAKKAAKKTARKSSRGGK